MKRIVTLSILYLSALMLFTVTGCYVQDEGTTGEGSVKTVVTPVFTPTEGSYSTDQSVSITCVTDGAEIFYTTDGSTPDDESARYISSSPIAVIGNGTTMLIKAIAIKDGMNDSEVTEASYTINYDRVSTPAFSYVSGVYATDILVKITCETPSATIRYTTDGTDPTSSSPIISSSSSIPVTGNNTYKMIRAIAMKSGMQSSEIVTAEYTIDYEKVATPVFAPAAGTYKNAITVELTCETDSAIIRYTTNGTDPDAYSTRYYADTKISLSTEGTKTIRAIAIKTGMETSDIASATYTINFNDKPIANTGINHSVALNEECVLDGSLSNDADNDPLTYTWTLVTKPDGSVASLSDVHNVKPSFTADMLGTYTMSLVVNDGIIDSSAVTVTVTSFTKNSGLDYTVIDAEYSNSLDRIVMVSTNPNRLHIYNPADNTERYVDLPLVPMSVSVGPAGTDAAVGFDGFVSYINLSTASLVKTMSVSAAAFDTVLAGNGFIYVFPLEDQWENIRCINISTAAETLQTGSLIYDSTHARLHPDGNNIYGADNGLSPSDIEKYSITGGTAVYAYDSPYHGDYAMSGNLWFSEDGLRIYVRGGNVFKSSAVKAEDMTYNGKLPGSGLVRELDQSGTAGKVCLITDSAADDMSVKFYAYEYSTYEKSLQLPYFTVNGKSYAGHGMFVFFNAAGSSCYVISKADASASMLKDYSIVTF